MTLFGKRYQETFFVKGMMCEKCASRVRDALLSLPGSKKALVDVEKGKVTLVSSKEIAMDQVAATIAGLGYSFEGKQE